MMSEQEQSHGRGILDRSLAPAHAMVADRRPAVRGVGGAVCLVLAGLCWTPLSAQTATETPQLDERFDVGQQKADFIVVIDRSLTMRPYWPAVVSAMSAFVAALPDGDHVAVVTFDKHASNSMVLPRVVNAATRASLLVELERLPPPQRILTDDHWNFTDLGEGLAKTLDEINRPEANSLTFVFLVTDFLHEPHGTSSFRSLDLRDPSWQALIERSRSLRSNRVLRSFALILPLDRRAGRDIEHARAVLGHVPEVRVDASTLGPWFARMGQEIRREKLAALVAADIVRGWEWSVRLAADRVEVQLLSHLEHLPFQTTVGALRVDGADTSVDPDGRHVLAPGAAHAWPIAAAGCTPEVPLWRWLLTRRRTERVVTSIHVEGAIDFEPADEFVRLGLRASQPLDTVLVAETPRTSCGAPLWLQFILLAGLVASTGITWRTWLRPAPAVRLYVRRLSLSGPGHSESWELPIGNVKHHTVGNNQSATLRSSLGPPEWGITLLSTKPVFPKLRPQRGLYAFRSSGSIFYRGREYDSAARRWVERDISLPDHASRAVAVGFNTRLTLQHAGGRYELTFHSR